MPLVTSKELLLDAQRNGYAVGAFNVENLEMVQAVVEAAEELHYSTFLIGLVYYHLRMVAGRDATQRDVTR